MKRDEVCVFALNASLEFGRRVGAHLAMPLVEHEEREFEDGEHKARPLVNVRGRDVFVIQSLYGDERQSVNDKLCRLLFFLGALKDASAERVTAVVPYLCYARKDRKSQARDPVTTGYVARLFEAVGTDRVITLDVHNPAAYQNAFRCRTDHLEAVKAFVDYFAARLTGGQIVALSPDTGGIKRAEKFRGALSSRLQRPVGGGFMEKYRAGGVVSGATLVADVKDCSVIIFDDLISTGTTLSRAAAACRAAGARQVYAAATHGLFAAEANAVLRSGTIDQIVVTNTVAPFRLDPALAAAKVIELDVAPLFAAAIDRIHSGGSIVELLQT
jgi:ribose-phosphate pyrophosphokinase